jgi:OOP family OmpA-OmpF porin
MITLALVGTAAALTAPPALALDPKPTSWASGFIGVTLGASKTYDYSAGSGTVLTTNDDTDFAYVVFGGYQFQKYFGLAGAWVDLGSTSYAGTVANVAFTDTLGVDGFNLMPMGFFPLSAHNSLFGYVGAYRWSQSVNYNDVNGPYTATDHGTSPSVGFGYNWYALDHSLGIHAEYSYFFNVGDNDNSGHEYNRDFLSVGMVWNFR